MKDIRLPTIKTISELFLVFGLVVIGLFAGTLVALLTAKPFFTDVSLTELIGKMGQMSNNPSDKWLALYVQGMAASAGFGMAPFLFAKYLSPLQEPMIFGKNSIKLMPWLLTFTIMAFAMPFVSYLEEWNKAFVFPESLKSLEIWFRHKEDEIAELTKWLTKFESFSDFLFAFLVVGVVAGVAEEYLFRGVIQPRLIALFGNVHVGIWLTGFVFGAIHVQFYGLFPRMMLGVLLGYLAFYSGKLQYAMVGHILNNGMVVILLYFNSLQITSFDMESALGISWYVAIVSIIATFWQIISFRNQYKKIKAIY